MLGIRTAEVSATGTLITGGLRASRPVHVSARLTPCNDCFRVFLPIPTYTHQQSRRRRPLIQYVLNAKCGIIKLWARGLKPLYSLVPMLDSDTLLVDMSPSVNLSTSPVQIVTIGTYRTHLPSFNTSYRLLGEKIHYFS